MNRTGDLVRGQQSGEPLDLAPVAEPQDILPVAAGVGAFGSDGRRIRAMFVKKGHRVVESGASGEEVGRHSQVLARAGFRLAQKRR